MRIEKSTARMPGPVGVDSIPSLATKGQLIVRHAYLETKIVSPIVVAALPKRVTLVLDFGSSEAFHRFRLAEPDRLPWRASSAALSRSVMRASDRGYKEFADLRLAQGSVVDSHVVDRAVKMAIS